MTSAIRVTRKVSIGGGSFRSYKIYIDGVYRGKIISAETKEFPVENGGHTIYAKLGWWVTSHTLDVTTHDSIVDIEVGSERGLESPVGFPREDDLNKFIFIRKL